MLLTYKTHQQIHISKYAQSHMIILHLNRVMKNNNMGLNMPQNVILLVHHSSEQNLTIILNSFTRLFKSEVGFTNIGVNAIVSQNLKKKILQLVLPWPAC